MDKDSDLIATQETPSGTGSGSSHAPWTVPAVLVACTSVSVLSTDLYTPSLPHLPRLLDSDAKSVQLTMSLNLAAFAVAQLFHGPLSDRYGRRRLLILGFLCFIIASLACAAAPTIGVLIAGRIAQGLCVSVASVVVILIIRELYDEAGAVRIMGFYGLALGAAPAIGPLIGGYVFLWTGWRSNFLLLALLAAGVITLLIRFLPETGCQDPNALRPRRIAADYIGLLLQRAYLRYLLPLSCLFGSFFAFVTAGPFLLIDRLGVATEDYGLYYAVLVLAFMAGSLSVTRLAGRVHADHLVRTAIICAMAGAALLLIPLLTVGHNLLAIVAAMAALSFGIGLILASGPVCLLDAVKAAPQGPASALVGSLQVGAASLAGLLVGSFHDGTAWPLALTVSAYCLISGLGYVLLRPTEQPAEGLEPS